MANANSTGQERQSCEIDDRVRAAEREISQGIQALGYLWVVLDRSLDNGTEGASCSIAIELLPVIGGRLDNAMAVLGMVPTGRFEEVLAHRGMTFSASGITGVGGKNHA